MEKSLFDIVLESNYNYAKAAVLEESGHSEAGQRGLIVISEAASALDKVKKFVSENKGKIAAGVGTAALAGGGYYAYKNGMLDDLLKKINAEDTTDKDKPEDTEKK